MKSRLLAAVLTAAVVIIGCGPAVNMDAVAAAAVAKVGQPAPAFQLVDTSGKTRSLAEFAGKTVVLEWNNPDCPFVKKHYGAGNMQRQQKGATAAGVVWLSINTSAEGKQGHLDGDEANEMLAERNAAPSAYLLDPAGSVGRAYGAQTTPAAVASLCCVCMFFAP